MKKLVYASVILMGSMITSCAPDKTDDPNAPTPSVDARDKYVAYWNVSENSAVAGTNTHTVNVTKSTTNSNEIILNNFSGLSVSARASVSNNILTIPYQTIGSPNPIGFTKGSGTMNSANNSIVMTYTTTISSSPDSCTATYTK
ncbi:MAG: hypothetical protein V4677_06480 [Bacteroidota bacterium]